jgi:hypothetical protein
MDAKIISFAALSTDEPVAFFNKVILWMTCIKDFSGALWRSM